MVLATGQWLAILPKIGGSISIIASIFVIRDILTRTKNLNSTPLGTAIILGKCVLCCLFSFFGPLMSTWMAPRGEAFYALGNATTCEIQGFITTFSIVSFLAYFIALVAVHAIKNKQVMTDSELNGKNFKRLALLMPLALAFAAACIPLFNGSFNFSGIYSCSIASYPLGCGLESGIPCTRGAHARRTVELITFSFNAIAYLVAFFGYYTEGKSDHHFFQTWPAMTMKFTICLSFFVGAALVVSYGAASAKLFAFYLSVTLTPLTGFFLALIYFHASKLSSHQASEDDTGLSEPLMKSSSYDYAKEEDIIA